METLFNNGALFFASEIKRKANAVGSCLQIIFTSQCSYFLMRTIEMD